MFVTRSIDKFSCRTSTRGNIIRNGVFEDIFWGPWPWPQRSSRWPWPQVLKNCPVLGSRTALFFELLKFCWSPEKNVWTPFFLEFAWKVCLKNFFFWEKKFFKTVNFLWRTLAPVSLASKGSVLGRPVLGLEPYVLDSTSDYYSG